MGVILDNDYKNLLEKLNAGGLTGDEKEALQAYIINSFHDHKLDSLMHDNWNALSNYSSDAEEERLLRIKDRIKSRIIQNESSSRTRSTVFSKVERTFIRLAAILLVPVLLGSLFVLHMRGGGRRQDVAAVIQQVSANPGSRVHFFLPDKTEVWLNSESTLEFSSDFKKKGNREVRLTGQGYFKVAHDPSHPFWVETSYLSIKALGTAFDVSCYSNDTQVISTLEEGNIELYGKDGEKIALLLPGDKATLNILNNDLDLRQVETRLTTSWKDGKLIFRNTSLMEVTRQLERWFNCKITVDPQLLCSDLYYTATIQDETLGEVLKMIEISTSVKTKIERREVYLFKE